jgi:hypothetical protein
MSANPDNHMMQNTIIVRHDLGVVRAVNPLAILHLPVLLVLGLIIINLLLS